MSRFSDVPTRCASSVNAPADGSFGTHRILFCSFVGNGGGASIGPNNTARMSARLLVTNGDELVQRRPHAILASRHGPDRSGANRRRIDVTQHGAHTIVEPYVVRRDQDEFGIGVRRGTYQRILGV